MVRLPVATCSSSEPDRVVSVRTVHPPLANRGLLAAGRRVFRPAASCGDEGSASGQRAFIELVEAPDDAPEGGLN